MYTVYIHKYISLTTTKTPGEVSSRLSFADFAMEQTPSSQ